jgi:hypothetical protein
MAAGAAICRVFLHARLWFDNPAAKVWRLGQRTGVRHKIVYAFAAIRDARFISRLSMLLMRCAAIP